MRQPVILFGYPTNGELIETQVRSEIQTLEEFQQRALNMRENLALAHQISESTLARYRSGALGVVDLPQTINREGSTADNLFDAFMGYRRALVDLQQLTYFDFERNIPVIDRYGIGVSPEADR